VSVQAGSQKAALASLLLFFAIGLLILTGVSTSAANPEVAARRGGQKPGKGRLNELDRES